MNPTPAPRRRAAPGYLLACVLFFAPLTAGAQPAGKAQHIGMLETRSPALNAANVDAFRTGLQELGYREGQNFELVYRSSDGRDERFPDLARELVRLKVDLIVTRGTPAALAAKNASRTIPIVMAASGAPVESGLVASLARPGGNITGLSSGIGESYPKRVELLGELLPRLKRLAVILNMANPSIPRWWPVIQESARSIGVEAHLLDVRSPENLSRLFETAAKQRAEALIVGLDGITQANLRPIAELAVKHRLPSIYPARGYAEVGGLLAYGSSDVHMYHRAAIFVDKILKGANPADLPVEQPTRWELVVNLKTAKALGVAIPPSLLLRADHIIE
jgi:putative ABC transport system substrate-binding protein